MDPLLFSLILGIHFGRTFDLVKYEFMPEEIYHYNEIKNYTKLTNIDELTAKYALIESPKTLWSFMDVNTATYLKIKLDKFEYPFKEVFYTNVWSLDKYPTVDIAFRITLETINETIPVGTPTYTDLKSLKLMGTHYVKTIIYGTEIVEVFHIKAKSEEHRHRVINLIKSKLGTSGTLDDSFEEKFQEVLKKAETYYHSNFHYTTLTNNQTPGNITELINMKNKVRNIPKTSNNGKGHTILYELHSLSELSSSYSPIEVNKDIEKHLDQLALMLYDVEYTSKFLSSRFYTRPTLQLTEEEETKIGKIIDALDNAEIEIKTAIDKMDITTSGNINQFDEAYLAYGSRNDTTKYIRWLYQLLNEIPQLDF